MPEEWSTDQLHAHYRATGEMAPAVPKHGGGENKPRKEAKEKVALVAWLHHTYPGQVVSEYRFHPTRRWRFDWALPDLKVAIEFEGVVSKSAHTTVTNVLNDSAKFNEAALAGWLVVRTNTPNLRDGSGYQAIERAVAQKEAA